MYILGKHIVLPSGSSGTANQSLAPQIGVPLYKLASFSKATEHAGLFQGANGARPVIFTSRTKGTLSASIQQHPNAFTKT